MKREITIVAGPCAAESEKQIMDMGYKISLIRDVARDYEINFKFRAGCWKPRTKYYETNGERIFEGVREVGLEWLGRLAEKYSLPIVSEVMSENDLRHFERYLEPERDFLQIGARNSQNFALLYNVGGKSFNVLLKNPQHGVDVEEMIGSFERFKNNREKVYCVRGQKKFINPNPIAHESYQIHMKDVFKNINQDPDARNLNNIGVIHELKQHPYFSRNNILLCYDPSHTFGGKNDRTRRDIGEYGIKAIRDYGYDLIMVEVNDKSSTAKCDKEQALLTTFNNIDWSQTYVGKEPEIKPLTLVDITKVLMRFQVKKLGLANGKLDEDGKKLDEIRWDMTAQ